MAAAPDDWAQRVVSTNRRVDCEGWDWIAVNERVVGFVSAIPTRRNRLPTLRKLGVAPSSYMRSRAFCDWFMAQILLSADRCAIQGGKYENPFLVPRRIRGVGVFLCADHCIRRHRASPSVRRSRDCVSTGNPSPARTGTNSSTRLTPELRSFNTLTITPRRSRRLVTVSHCTCTTGRARVIASRPATTRAARARRKCRCHRCAVSPWATSNRQRR